MIEDWRTIEDYPNYMVSNLGNVKSTITGKLLKPIVGNGGYLQVNLYENGNRKTHKIHKLVSYAFQDICGLYFDGCECDHLDTNKNNNIAENLRNVTPLENHNNPLTKLHISNSRIGKPSWGLGLKYTQEHRDNISKALKGKCPLSTNPNSKAIVQFDLDMNLIKKWDCLQDAVNELGIPQPIISKSLTNRRKTGGGFIWKYKFEYDIIQMYKRRYLKTRKVV